MRDGFENIPGVILAGGQSRRMGGGDKALLQLGDRPILGHVIDRITPQVSGLALNANGPADRFEKFGLPVLGDTISGFVGPLAGVLAAMDWALGLGADQVVTVAADTPHFPAGLVVDLQHAAAGAGQIVLAATRARGGTVMRQPTFGLWPTALRDDLENALLMGTRKVVAWTDSHGAGTAVFDSGGYDPFFNINTAGDLEIARAELAARR
ncbi:MAG: molybdenum cofactor guanylyltransferase MobA [Paracoccaceae bacterium]